MHSTINCTKHIIITTLSSDHSQDASEVEIWGFWTDPVFFHPEPFKSNDQRINKRNDLIDLLRKKNKNCPIRFFNKLYVTDPNPVIMWSLIRIWLTLIRILGSDVRPRYQDLAYVSEIMICHVQSNKNCPAFLTLIISGWGRRGRYCVMLLPSCARNMCSVTI